MEAELLGPYAGRIDVVQTGAMQAVEPVEVSVVAVEPLVVVVMGSATARIATMGLDDVLDTARQPQEKSQRDGEMKRGIQWKRQQSKRGERGNARPATLLQRRRVECWQ